MDYDKLTEDEFMKLLGAVDKAEAALHVFRASLVTGGARAGELQP